MKLRMVLTVLTLALFFAGCSISKSYQLSTDFNNQSGELKKVGIVFDVHIYTQSGEDVTRSARSMKYFEAASVRELADMGFAVTVLSIDDDLRALSAQYRGTRGNIAKPFPDNHGEVEGLAPLPGMIPVAAKENVDGIVIVNGIDNLPTSSGVVGGLALSALTGVYWGANTIAFADFAILNKMGKIVFYDRRHGENYNLTDDESVSKVTSEFAKDFVIARQLDRAK